MSHPLGRRGALLFGAASVSACALPLREPAVPRGETARATVLGLPNERFMPAFGSGPINTEFEAAVRRRLAHLGAAPGVIIPPLDLIAVSGGGEDGAFGAGLLNGWSLEGTRPEFTLVTGVSTGALTAPFAFLGADYDAALKRVYTEVTFADIAIRRFLVAAFFNDALADSSPLYATISRELDTRMLARIAEGYRQGRLLLIGTTDLDAQIPVLWNIGAIAASGHPRGPETIHKILLASASIPGAFPPVLFDVTVDGQPHQELHVDGGAVHQAFLYPNSVTAVRRAYIAARRPVREVRAWLIRNGRIDADWATTDRRTLSIAQRAVTTMIAASGFNDANRIWLNAQRDQVEFRMAYIGRDFTTPLPAPFDQTYMRALYEYGFARARRGYDWSDRPPFNE